LANDQDTKPANKKMVESTHIEYGLKSLLLFGQCHDLSHSTPPNGLQLVLDRSKSGSETPDTGAESAEIQPDGSQQLTGSNQVVAQKESTDTVVMKTAGYWQLRANPGVWKLRIAEKSRGAEIYNMVEGSVGRSGKVQLSKKSLESVSKILVMKDFTN